MDKWVNVKDELPPVDLDILVAYVPTISMGQQLEVGITRRFDVGSSANYPSSLVRSLLDNNGFRQKVLYWMYLPEVPVRITK